MRKRKWNCRGTQHTYDHITKVPLNKKSIALFPQSGELCKATIGSLWKHKPWQEVHLQAQVFPRTSLPLLWWPLSSVLFLTFVSRFSCSPILGLCHAQHVHASTPALTSHLSNHPFQTITLPSLLPVSHLHIREIENIKIKNSKKQRIYWVFPRINQNKK